MENEENVTQIGECWTCSNGRALHEYVLKSKNKAYICEECGHFLSGKNTEQNNMPGDLWQLVKMCDIIREEKAKIEELINDRPIKIVKKIAM